ncbi:MAG: hypothetical protein R3B47_15325 [Bacteroidia bacterium]
MLFDLDDAHQNPYRLIEGHFREIMTFLGLTSMTVQNTFKPRGLKMYVMKSFQPQSRQQAEVRSFENNYQYNPDAGVKGHHLCYNVSTTLYPLSGEGSM